MFVKILTCVLKESPSRTPKYTVTRKSVAEEMVDCLELTISSLFFCCSSNSLIF